MVPARLRAPALGVLQSAAVEESNVDLTGELVNMITQQRAYQANAQSIKTRTRFCRRWSTCVEPERG
jgi:flagellar hook protein FlgE